MLAFMNRARTKRANGEDGFTLIELLVVVVILGILIAIAIPVYLNYKKSANDKAAQSDLRNAISTLEVCNSVGSYPSAVDPATGAMTGCGTATDAKANLSANTTFTYSTVTNGYIALATNSGGTKKYCYNSVLGGAVKQVATSVTTC